MMSDGKGMFNLFKREDWSVSRKENLKPNASSPKHSKQEEFALTRMHSNYWVSENK